MSMAIDQAQPGIVPQNDFFPANDVRAHVLALLNTLYPRGDLPERRAQQRFPYPHLVCLTSVAEDGTTRRDETVVVVGKHLSERGLGFYHQQPLAHRRMIASLETTAGSWLGLLIDLSWCRFTKQGWYESGGRFIQTVPSPLDPNRQYG